MPSLFTRTRETLCQIREDLRTPIEGANTMSRRERYSRRLRMLAGRYGWKFVAVAMALYLIRDLILYVLIPWIAVTALCD